MMSKGTVATSGWALSLGAGLLVAGCGAQGAAHVTPVRIGQAQIQTGGSRLAGLGDAFAGVIRTGDVRSIGARWQVPAIRAGSQPGRAATWIGAQVLATKPGTAFIHTPFIQIGTREELDRSSPRGGRGGLLYEAFWTDTTRGLHPLSLLAVRPGDTVAARMDLHDHRWTLTIADQTTGQRRRVSTGDEGSGHFRLALWLQEDPTSTATHRVFAYPDLSPVRVSGLTVNAATPAPASLETTWMALPHAYLGPTAPADGGFSVVPRTLSAAGQRYLKIADPADAELDRFLAVSSTWRRGVSASVVRAAVNRLIASLALNTARLNAQSWPARVAGPIGRLARVTAREVTGLRRAVHRGAAAGPAALSGGPSGQAHRLADRIREDLGLPLGSY